MSPEQATADRDPGPQSDVYSLACMLYEMLVGDPPHTGSSAQAVLAKILTERPRSVTELRQTVPPHVGAAVAKALERLPADRFDTADAFVKALDDASFTHLTVAKTAAMLAAPSSPGATRRGRVISALPWTVAAVATSVAMWALGSEPAAAPVTRVYLTTPEGQGYSEAGRNPAANALAISPDGSQLVYAGPGDASTAGRGQLWRRPLNALEAVPITGTEQGTAPRFSNDGRQLAFMSDGRIGVMLAEGGTPVWLQNGSPAFAWGDDDAIYFTAVGELRRWVPGEAESTSLGEVGAGGVYDVLPGSAAYLIGAPEGMAVFDAATGESHTLGAGRRPRYLDTGHIVFARLADGVLLVQPFDVRTLATTGPAVSTSAAVRTGGVGSDFGLAADGTLVYAVGGEGSGERLAWVDRSGATEVIDWIEPASFDGIDLSPSGNRVAAGWSGGVSGRGSTDIWVFDLTERSQNRLTTDGQSIRPQWHPIEPRIAFVHDGSPERSISSIAADGSGAAELVVAITDGGPADAWWTQDGRELLLRIQGASLRSIFRFVPGEDEVPQPWLDREFNERNPAPSPDGNWLVYSSDQSGRDEVYAQPYPGRGAVQNVSIDGGSQAVWSRDGREIFFVGTDGFMWSATVSYDTSSFRVESRQRLFELNEDLGADIQRPNWDVAPDGRFLMTRGDTERGASALVLVRNWVQEITGRR